MHIFSLNTATIQYCCSDLVLFVDLFCFLCVLLFDFRVGVCGGVWVWVCMKQCYIWEWTACLDGLGWHFWIVLVPLCLPKWMGAHSVTHTIDTPMHVFVRNGLPFAVSLGIFQQIKMHLYLSYIPIWGSFYPFFILCIILFYYSFFFFLEYLPFGLPKYPVNIYHNETEHDISTKRSCIPLLIIFILRSVHSGHFCKFFCLFVCFLRIINWKLFK